MLKKVSVKVFLSHIFCNKKLVVVTMLNFLFEVREVHEVLVSRSSVSRKKHGTSMFAADK